MINLYRHRYRQGETENVSPSWYLQFRDHRGRRRRLSLFPDKRRAEGIRDRIEDLVARRGRGLDMTADLVLWYENLPPRISTKLARWGLVDYDTSVSQTLAGHVADFEEHLRARGVTERHRLTHRRRVERVLVRGCGYKHFAEIAAVRVMSYLRDQREREKRPLSRSSSNHLLRACKQFTRWMVEYERARVDPLLAAKPVAVAKSDEKRRRRALSRFEQIALIRAAEKGPDWHGLSGTVRALLWRTALGTGMRVSELERFRVGDLQRDEEGPFIVIARQKNGEESLLPIPPDLAGVLEAHVSGRAPEEPAFALESRYWRKLAQALLGDLVSASIPYVDRHGRYADVHALRHTFATTAGEVAEDLATLQAMTRHKTASMALRYAHSDAAKMRRAATRLGLELGQVRGSLRTPVDDNGASQAQDAASAS